MEKSVKAALFSGLLFPGTGHFILKRYARGMVFFLPSLASLAFIVANVIQRAMSAVDKIASGAVPADMETIMRLVTASESDALKLNIATAVLMVCWAVAIIDSYRIGKREDDAVKRSSLGK